MSSGWLVFFQRSSHSFASSEINFTVIAAQVGGVAIRNAKTYQQISLLFNQIEENERFLTDILN